MPDTVDLSSFMGTEPAKPSASVDKKTFIAQMDKTFGKGKWNLTSGYRTRQQEDDLRTKGAGTVPKGQTSDHSVGSEDAPGAYDVQVPGLTPAQVAAKLKASDPDFHVIAEGRHGPEGPHAHIGVSPKVDLSGFMGTEPDRQGQREMVTARDRAPVTQHQLLQRMGGETARADALRTPLTTKRPLNWFQQAGMDVANRVREGAADVENAAKGGPATSGPGTVLAAVNVPFQAVAGVGETAGRGTNAIARGLTGQKGPETPTEERVRHEMGDLAALGASVIGPEEEIAAAAKLPRASLERLAGGEAGPELAAAAKKRLASAPAAVKVAAPARTAAEAYSQHVQTLKDNGVYLTPGQEVGGEKARIESAQKSNPLWSAARREDADKAAYSYMRSVYNRVLAPIGVKVKDGVFPSRDAVGGIEQMISGVYNQAKPGIRAVVDAPTTEAIEGAVKAAAVNGEAEQGKLRQFIDQIVTPNLKDGVLDGEGYIKVKSELSKRIRGMKGDPSFHVRESAEQYQQVLDAIMDSAERYSAPGVREKLKAADTSWAMLTRLQEASTRRQTGQGQFSPQDLISAVRHQSPSVGGRRPAFARGDALLQDIADAGVAVLPDRVPASDTAEKMQRNNRGVAGAVAGNVIGGPVGAVAGYAVDRAAPKVTNLALKALLDARAKKLSPGSSAVSGARTPQNYLARVSRATSPLVNHRAVPAVNTLAVLANQPQNAP